MTTTTNFDQYVAGEYNNEIRIVVTKPTTNGLRIARNSLSDAIHQNDSPTQHSTHAHVIRNKNANYMFKGAWEMKFEWDSGDFTETQIDDYISLITPFSHPNMTYTKDMANNRLTIDISDADITISDWGNYQPQWLLKTDRGTITSKNDGGEKYCINVLNNRFSDYTIESKTIAASASETIDKQGSNYCFVIFTGDVTKGSTTLNAHQAYRVTSSSVTVTNSSSTDKVRVFRIYR